MRTVICGYCGEHGHNRRTCTFRKKQEDKELQRNPDSVWSRRIKSSRAKKDITCSYCKKSGHNRRKCSLLKKDKAAVQAAYTGYRKKFASRLKECGFGVGAIVKVPTAIDPQCDSYYVGMITEMHWDAVVHTYGSTAMYANQVAPNERRFAEMQVIKIVDGDYKLHRMGWSPIEEGQKAWLTVHQIAQLLPDLFPFYNQRISSRKVKWSAEVLSFAAYVNIPEDYFHKEISDTVQRTYRFNISGRSLTPWEKQRVKEDNSLWRGVY